MKSVEKFYEDMEFPTFPMSELSRDKLSKQIKQDFKNKYGNAVFNTLISVLDSYKDAKKAGALDKKHNKIQGILLKLHNLSLTIGEKNNQIDYLISSLLMETGILYNEVFKDNPESFYFLLSNSNVYHKRGEFEESFKSLNRVFSSIIIQETFLDSWGFYIKRVPIFKEINALEFQVNALSNLDDRIVDELINSIKYLSDKMNVNFNSANFSDIHIEAKNFLLEFKMRIGEKTEKSKEAVVENLLEMEGQLQQFYSNGDKVGAIEYILKINAIYQETKKFVEKYFTPEIEYGDLDNNTSYYLMATRAQGKKDYAKAEKLFQKSISEKEKDFEDSIIDYIRMKTDTSELEENSEPEEFLEVAESFERIISDEKKKIDYYFLLITYYKKLKLLDKDTRMNEGLKIIDKLIRIISRSQDKNHYMQQLKSAYVSKGFTYLLNFDLPNSIENAMQSFKTAKKYKYDDKQYNLNMAFCLLKKDNIIDAERLLKFNINNFNCEKSKSMLNNLKFYQTAASVDDIDVDDIDVEVYTTDSREEIVDKFNESYINNHKNQGALEGITKKSNRHKDLLTIIKIANEAANSEKAELLLKAALIQENLDGRKTQKYFTLLSDSLQSKANCYFEADKLENAKIYYLMSLANIEKRNSKPEVDLKLIAKYLFAILKDKDINVLNSEVDFDRIIIKCLNGLLIGSMQENIFKDLSLLFYFSKGASTQLIKIIEKKSKLVKSFLHSTSSFIESKDLKSLFESMAEKISKSQPQYIANLQNVFQLRVDNSSTSQMWTQIGSSNFFSPIDVRILSVYKDILNKFRELDSEPGYYEKIIIINDIKRKIQDLKDLITEEITFLTIFLVEEIKKLKDKADLLTDRVNDELKPELEVSVPDTSVYYTESDSFQISVTIRNKLNHAPAKNVIVQLFDQDNNPISSEVNFGTIKFSESRGISIQRQDNTFTLIVKVRYRDNNDEEATPVESSFSINIQSQDAFQEIDNPYITGVPIEGQKMFFGRDKLLNDLENEIMNKNTSIVLYGQKRSGKTSVFVHLGNRLREKDFIVLRCDISGTLDDDASFYYAVRNELLTYIDFELDNVEMRDELESLKYETFSDFKRFIKRVKRDLSNLLGREVEFLMMIDEFTSLYGAIQDGTVSRRFMKVWKAMLEAKLFRVVVVGQDTMLDFLNEFPNQFGITKNVRIPYLDSLSSKRLIEEPILNNGKTRYLENSVDKIYEFTGGHPLYTQIFCSELVNHLNQKKLISVTNGVVGDVKQIVLQAMGEDKFDNLINKGDGSSQDSQDKQVMLEVLQSIAKVTQYNEWCNIADIKVNGKERILDDLQNRKVIEFNKSGSCKIVLNIFKEWLLKKFILRGNN